jgi:nucleoside-diphosphate-sugar epimerase
VAKFTIFGAAGFIGSHLSASLERAGHDVASIGRNDFPTAGRSLGHVIYCIGLTADFRERPVATVDAHVCVLADVLASYRFESFLYLSSARVYAGTNDTREDAALLVRPELPDHIYNLSKLTGEALCLAQAEPSVRVARISNVVGRADPAVNFLPSLLAEARREGKVVVRTSKQSSKDYIDIRDVCAVLERIALGGKSRLYNVASGVNTSNETIAAAIARGCAAHVEFAGGAPTNQFPPIDISRIRNEFMFCAIPFAQSVKLLFSDDSVESGS